MLHAQRKGGVRKRKLSRGITQKTSTLASALAAGVATHFSTLPGYVKVVGEHEIQQVHEEDEVQEEDPEEDEVQEDLGPPSQVEKWVQLIGGPFTIEDQLCADVRKLQQRSGCSDVTCAQVVELFRKYLGIDVDNFRKYDQQMEKAAGVQILRLNGCPKCNNHVYLPTDKDQTCPQCGHNRYDDEGKPLEVIFYPSC